MDFLIFVAVNNGYNIIKQGISCLNNKLYLYAIYICVGLYCVVFILNYCLLIIQINPGYCIQLDNDTI